MGGLRAIGGGFEAFAGYTLAAASGAFGVGTSPTGIGAVAGAAGVVGGVALGAHGVDTFQSGIRQMWTGKAVDSITSTGLQAAGMSPQAANLTDAGISLVGSFGAGAATRGLTALAPKTIPQPTGQFYSTAFEMKLAPTSYIGSRGAHFQEANGALLRAMEADARVASSMQQLGINLSRTPTGLAPRTSPVGWTWHHAPEPGVMQLVPRAQHAPGSIFQPTLHPGGAGGYSIWGK